MAQDVGPSASTHPVPSVETPLAGPITRILPQSPTATEVDMSSVPAEVMERMRETRARVLEMLQKLNEARRELNEMSQAINDKLVQIDMNIYSSIIGMF
jgi:hypothetical protein